MVSTLRSRKIPRMAAAVRSLVGCRTGFSIRCLVAKANFTYELLISTKRYSVDRFLSVRIRETHFTPEDSTASSPPDGRARPLASLRPVGATLSLGA